MLEKILEKPLTIPFLLAIVFHTFFICILPKTKIVKKNVVLSTKALEVFPLSSHEIRKFRTVGTPGGKKEFSAPIKKSSSSNKLVKASNNLALQNPELIPKALVQLAPQKITKELFPTMKGLGLPNSSLNVGFEPPEGVSETELNSTEKIYYGFSKRIYELYISSLISSYNKIIMEKPYLDLSKIVGNHNLTGRIIFNKNGNAVGTQFFLQSPNELIQQLFENTLMDIRTIPNPPKGLLGLNDTFAIHYRLQIGIN